ncbi:MAG: DUF742 domain-containing protein [Jatrophihabitantaceae bacterium]
MTDPESTSGMVRPYALTGGRTRSEHSYPLEALVLTSFAGERLEADRSPESQAICQLCVHSRSVAEIAAHLHVPIGVTRVLVGDLADEGLVLVHVQSQDAPDTELLERVLGGLRKL